MKMNIIFFISSIICIIINLGIIIYTNRRKSSFDRLIKQKQKEIDKLLQEQDKINEDIRLTKTNYSLYLKDYERRKFEKEELEKDVSAIKKLKNELIEDLDSFKKLTAESASQYEENLEKQYKKVEKDYDNALLLLELDKKSAEGELIKIKNSLTAGIEAQLREKEIAEKTNFYQLYISEDDLEDVEKLNKIKKNLHQPIILSKLIWTTYFQKQTTSLCNRVFGLNQKCGIYKITNITTGQCYIGQSVNIQDRIKQHCKCGLGIDASATNKLYKNMQDFGIWNFTFELLEECSKDQLNEKERTWIEVYQSDKYGLNSTKGNK